MNSEWETAWKYHVREWLFRFSFKMCQKILRKSNTDEWLSFPGKYVKGDIKGICKIINLGHYNNTNSRKNKFCPCSFRKIKPTKLLTYNSIDKSFPTTKCVLPTVTSFEIGMWKIQSSVSVLLEFKARQYWQSNVRVR